MAGKIISEDQYVLITMLAKKGFNTKYIATMYHVDEKTIRNILYKYELKYSKQQGIWYNPEMDKERLYMLNNCDIEEEIDILSSKRYFDRYLYTYPDNIENEKYENINLHNGIYDELKEISEEYGYDFVDELVELILLKFLDKNRKKDLTKEFARTYLINKGYDEKEMEMLLQHNYDDIIGIEELLWEEGVESTEEEMKRFYIGEISKNIDYKLQQLNQLKFKELKSIYDNGKEK